MARWSLPGRKGKKLRVTREVSFDRLRLRIRSKADWFEVGGELQVDDHLVLDMKRLLELIDAEAPGFCLWRGPVRDAYT